jgi:hypothetical protein
VVPLPPLDSPSAPARLLQLKKLHASCRTIGVAMNTLSPLVTVGDAPLNSPLTYAGKLSMSVGSHACTFHMSVYVTCAQHRTDTSCKCATAASQTGFTQALQW